MIKDLTVTTPLRDRHALEVHQIRAQQPRSTPNRSWNIYLSIIIPMYQEQHRIGDTLRDIFAWLQLQTFHTEIILVDDGSSDQTVNIVCQSIPSVLPTTTTRVQLLSHPFNRGKGAAVHTGFRHASGRWQLFMDADTAVPTSEIRRLLKKAIESQSDVVIATRHARDASVRMGLPRLFVSKCFNLNMKLLGIRYVSDTQCGCKLYSNSAAKYVAMQTKERGFAFDIEHLLLLRQAGYKVAEQPICWDEKAGGTVKPIRDGIRMLRAAAAIKTRTGTERITKRQKCTSTDLTHKCGSFRYLFLLIPIALLTCMGMKSYLDGRHGDFDDFYFAAQAITQGESPYASYEQGYLYPPVFAIVLTPLTVFSFAFAGALWCCINGAAMFAAVWVTAKRCIASLGLQSSNMLWPLGASAFMLLIDKARAVMMMGQTDAIVLLLCVLSLQWYRTDPMKCGAAMAGACMIKYQAIILLPYLILRGRWRELCSFAACIATLALAPSLIVGWGRNLSYLGESFSILSAVFGLDTRGHANPHPITWDRSVSITSAMARWTGSPFEALLVVTIACLGLLLIVMRVYSAHDATLFIQKNDVRSELLTTLEWFGLLAALLIFSPQTEARHMFLALPMVALGMTLILSVGVQRKLLLTGLLVFLTCLYLPPGGKMFDQYVAFWRSVGGASIGLLVLTLIVMKQALAARV